MNEKITMNLNDEEISLKKAFEKFIRVKEIENLSPETIEYYTLSYKFLAEIYDENNLCNGINQDTVFEYIDHIKKTRKVAQITVNTYVRGLRGTLYFFMDRAYITKKFKIKIPKCEKQIKETYTSSEIEKLIEKPNPNKCTFAEFRNWAAICYLLGTGNRLRTLINLKIGDIDTENMEIKLKTVKNKKAYIIPMSTTLKNILIEYLKYRKGNEEDFLFCTDCGEQFKSEGFKMAIKRYNRSRGIEKTSIHLFRHTFAKNWILNGGDIFRLQKILGHSSLEMVKEYVSMFGVDIKENFDNFNVLEKHTKGIQKAKISMKKQL